MLVLNGCWMAELGTPGGFVKFKGLPPDQTVTNYIHIVQHLQQVGFRKVQPKSPDSAWPLTNLFGGKPSGYFRDFIYDEKSNPYVISLQIDMNATHSAVNYQFGEYERIDENRMRPRIRAAMSAEGCKITKAANEYVVARLGREHLAYNGIPKCSA